MGLRSRTCKEINGRRRSHRHIFYDYSRVELHCEGCDDNRDFLGALRAPHCAKNSALDTMVYVKNVDFTYRRTEPYGEIMSQRSEKVEKNKKRTWDEGAKIGLAFQSHRDDTISSRFE